MAIPILAVLGIAGACLRVPLVDKALRNLASGTKNKIDDAVILAILTVAKLVPLPQRSAAVQEKLDKIQAEYDDLKANNPELLVEMKQQSDLDLSAEV